MKQLNRELGLWLFRIILAMTLFVVVLILPETGLSTPSPLIGFLSLRLGLALLSYIIIAYDVLWRSVRNIARGQFLDENFLMAIASIGAFLIGEYAEGLAVIIFYQIGEFFQNYAVDQSRRSIAELMDIRPDFANLIQPDGTVQKTDAYDVPVGAAIEIKVGERVPLDATVLRGVSTLDTSALTGEALPRDVAEGDEILSGCINLSGVLVAKVSKPFSESTVSKILDLVENATNKKSRSEQFITRFARVYTPIVVSLALLLALVPPLLFAAPWEEWIYRALAFLVVSCPCALVISVPLSFFSGIGAASRRGILVKGSNYLETLAQTNTFVFDKTGTLTEGRFEVAEIVAQSGSAEELLDLAAYAESASIHPISLSLLRALPGEIQRQRVTDIVEHAGQGVLATVDDRRVAVGNAKLMSQLGIGVAADLPVGTLVHVAADGRYLGYILITDRLKQDAASAISALQQELQGKIVLLTGDNVATAAEVAASLGIDSYQAGLLPHEKVAALETLLSSQAGQSKLAFIGDGINDAPVLARADIGIAMGGLGSDAAIEAADVVIMTDEPSKIVTAIRIARKTLRIAKQNIYGAIGIKLLVLLLSMLGLASIWAAVFADVGVTLLAVLNAFRTLRGRY